MAVTARGMITTPVDTLRTMLSACAGFQKLVQAANAAAALSSIFAFEEDGQPDRPFAVVDFLDNFAMQDISGGAALKYKNAGTLAIWLEAPARYDAVAISTANTDTIFTASALAGFADDHFNGLTLEMTSGDEEGETKVISDFAGATGQITLAGALSGAPSAAETFSIYGASDQDSRYFFANTLSDILSDLLAISGTAAYLALRNVRMEGGPWRSDPKTHASDYFAAMLAMEYGN